MNYKDEAVLREESEEGRRLGFDGKVRYVGIPRRPVCDLTRLNSQR